MPYAVLVQQSRHIFRKDGTSVRIRDAAPMCNEETARKWKQLEEDFLTEVMNRELWKDYDEFLKSIDLRVDND